MKKVIVISSIILAGLIALIFFAGGIHLIRINRYYPTSAGTVISESDFKPKLLPAFSGISSAYTRTIIPNFFYEHADSDLSPRVYLSLIRGGQPGFHGTEELVIESLSVESEGGRKTLLIGPLSPHSTNLASHLLSWDEDLGAFTGDVITIEAKGYLQDASGSKKYFTHSQSWKRMASTRVALGISLME